MLKPKHKIGTKLKRNGHINITVIGINIESSYPHYICYNTNDPTYKLTLTIEFLDDISWVNINPIWLNQKK